MVEEFFQEELDDLNNPLRSSQVRDRVQRSRIHAGIARIRGQPINPHDAQKLQGTLHKAFSGYVHAAYVHIMESYGGDRDDLRYRMRGMPERITEWAETISNYVYRTLIAVEIVARRCSDIKVAQSIGNARQELECNTDLGSTDANVLLARLQRK